MSIFCNLTRQFDMQNCLATAVLKLSARSYASVSTFHYSNSITITALSQASRARQRNRAVSAGCSISSMIMVNIMVNILYRELNSNIPKCPSSYYRMFSIFRFGISTQLQMILYPQVFYPLTHITLTASILMIVALTIERYCAVHYPTHFREVKCLKALI